MLLFDLGTLCYKGFVVHSKEDVQMVDYTQRCAEEVKKAIKAITTSSDSEEQVSQRIKDELRYNDILFVTSVNSGSSSSGSALSAFIVMMLCPKGNIITA
jgi:fructoselysine-6-P-deglycase FrlB-like protein